MEKLFINTNGVFDYSIMWSAISSIGTIIAFLALLVTIIFNIISQIHYKKGLEPQLSMNLYDFKGMLYLSISNTGKLQAKEIRISIEKIENNGGYSELDLEDLFSMAFELYPTEMVQGRVAFYNEDISCHVFPKIFVHVSYVRPDTKERREYRRSIIFSKPKNNKVFTDVSFGKGTIENSLSCIARANVRTANYLDGAKVASFDERNILADTSLYDDMHSIFCNYQDLNGEQPNKTKEI